MRKAMQTPAWRSICAMLCLLLLLPALFPVKAAAETAPAKVVRVGSFGDTFNYVNEKGIRKGYGYELLQTLSGYTGWQLEYVTCDWSDCFEKLKNGEIDIMGDISYTEDRTEEMLFSDEPMGEEKDYLYADLSRADISASDYKTLNGKKIGVPMGTEPEVMLTEWEEKYDLKTQHVNISNNEDVKQKLANHEIDCFVSLEESFWADLGISTITCVGSSDIYYAINKDRADIKEELDNAMRVLEDANPFYTADLYKRYFSMDYTPILTGEEKAWLKEHGAIRMGFLTGDSGVSTCDPATGEITGTITDYIQFAKDCLGNQELEFQMVAYDSKEAELGALKSGEPRCRSPKQALPDKVPCGLLSAVGDRGLRHTGGCGKAGQGRTGGLLCHRGQQPGKLQQGIRLLQRSAAKSCQILLCGQQRKRHPAVHPEQNDQGHAGQYAYRRTGDVQKRRAEGYPGRVYKG